MEVTAWRSEAATRLQDDLTGVLRGDGVRIVAVDATDDGALATFLTDDDPRLFGRVVPWDGEDYMTPSDWATDAWMHQMPWTTYGARRVDRSVYIEVTDDDLVVDRRFGVRSVGADGASFEAYVDVRSASVVVGRVQVTAVDGDALRRASFDVHPMAPATVTPMLAIHAATKAARTGHRYLVVASGTPELDVLGFTEDAGGDRVLDLAMLDIDVEGWHRIHSEAARSRLPAELLRPSGTWWERLTSRTRSVAR
jgi:hypothetical protein